MFCFHSTYTVKELLVSNFSNGIRNRTIVYQCDFIAMTVGNVPINTVEAGVQIAAAEPLGER